MQYLDIMSRDNISQNGLAWAWLGKRDNPDSFSAITVQEAVSGSWFCVSLEVRVSLSTVRLRLNLTDTLVHRCLYLESTILSPLARRRLSTLADFESQK